jgi:hypothetical protein
MPGLGRKTHFKTLQSFDSEYSTSKFTQYVSERTGMQVVVVDRQGPKISGYFTLATEIHDDSGARKCLSCYLKIPVVFNENQQHTHLNILCLW